MIGGSSTQNSYLISLFEKTDKTRFFPRDVYFVNKDGTEDPPVPLDQWQYPREAYIFLNFDGRDYPVPRSHVSDLAALTSSPHFEDRLFLHLPQGTSEGDFLTFYFFLFHGAYPPHLKVVNSEVIPYGSIQRGPPRIKPYEANAPTYLIGLITAYTLGKGLQYQPFCDFVVQGLYSLQSTAEDPIQVLEKIYRRRQKGMEHWAAGALSEPPDAQLRLWTKNWLTVELLSPDMGQYGSWFKTNRGVLRSHRDWSGMYAQLLAFSKELREDDEAAAGKLVPRKDNSDMLRVTSLPPAPETPMYRQGPSQLPHPSVIARQFMPPTRLPSAHQAENIPSRSGETLSFLDLSGLSQYLPDQFQQRHPEVPLRSVPSPLDTEAYGTWRVPEEGEMLRRWRELQKPDPPFNNIFDQRAPPGPEQPPRPF